MNDILIEAISNFVNIDNIVFELNSYSSPQFHYNIIQIGEWLNS